MDCYGTLIGNHRWRIDSCRLRWPWVTLKGGMRGVTFLRRILLNNLRTVWPRTTKFGRITRGDGCISMGSASPHPKGARSQRSPILGFLNTTYAYTLYRITTKFYVVTHMGRAVYLGVSHSSHPQRAEFQGSPIWGPNWGALELCSLEMGGMADLGAFFRIYTHIL